MNRYTIAALFCFACISVVSHIPATETIPPFVLPLWDKAMHFIVYLPLGACLAIGLRTPPLTLRAVTACVFVGLAVLLLGAIDEWHQSMVPGRTVSVADAVADVAGGMSGAVMGLLGVSMMRRQREERQGERPIPSRF